jgi:XTP/dITP diphosphohydrolase
MIRDLVLATHNPGKVREIAELLEPFAIAVTSAGELGLPEPEETGATFAENAAIKAEVAARASGKPALSDDSGLVVPALDGAPGIYSARWAGPGKDFAFAMKTIAEKLGAKASGKPAASFVCALALALPGEGTQIFEGRIDGHLVFPARGANGFGYDPIFVPEGHEKTFGEMDPAAKHAMSHRARAFRKLIDGYFCS